MQAWMVRAGSSGRREEQVLEDGQLLPGWDDVKSDLGSVTSRQELHSVLRSMYDSTKNDRTLASWAGQLWRFVKLINEDDFVAMPLKSSPGMVAIGKVTGPYNFDESAPEGRQHSRSIKWAKELIQKDALGPDLQASLGALPTICELSRNNAAKRISQIYSSGQDPDAPSSDESAPDEFLGRVAEQVQKGETFSTTVRQLLSLWGFYRRTANTVQAVNEALDNYGLITVPPITEGSIDDKVELAAQAISDNVDPETLTSTPLETMPGSSRETREDDSGGEVRYAVNSLASASRSVASVHTDTPLNHAVTNMMLNSYSQLAVVDNENRLQGAITWESIAIAWASKTPTTVSDAMVKAQSVVPTDELLSLTHRIAEHGYIFVRDLDGRVQGIVTAADLTRKFGEDQKPIIQLDEIERRLGSHISSVVTDDELKSRKINVPGYGKTLGTYVAALSDPVIWEKLGWQGLDQNLFRDLIDTVRKIRNDIMHFSPDPITSDEQEILARAMRSLRMITSDPE